MAWLQLVGVILLFVIDVIKRRWENNESKKRQYEELEKRMLEAIKARDTVKFFNIRRLLLRMREEA